MRDAALLAVASVSHFKGGRQGQRNASPDQPFRLPATTLHNSATTSARSTAEISLAGMAKRAEVRDDASDTGHPQRNGAVPGTGQTGMAEYGLAWGLGMCGVPSGNGGLGNELKASSRIWPNRLFGNAAVPGIHAA